MRRREIEKKECLKGGGTRFPEKDKASLSRPPSIYERDSHVPGAHSEPRLWSFPSAWVMEVLNLPASHRLLLLSPLCPHSQPSPHALPHPNSFFFHPHPQPGTFSIPIILKVYASLRDSRVGREQSMRHHKPAQGMVDLLVSSRASGRTRGIPKRCLFQLSNYWAEPS